jgi:hypothetical protein
MSNAIRIFKRKAPQYMRLLMRDFGFSLLDAAAILGNAGHESGGFTAMQERKPMVPGSRGGWGWFQWTGPRRRAFEAYVARNNLDPRSDDANYGFLFVELNGPERRAVAETKAAKGLENKVEAFEMAFERAGIKHYPSRITWAERALAAWNESALSAQPEPASPIEVGGASAVTDLQTKLTRLGYELGEIDGIIGPLTRDALSSFQADHGLTSSGVADAPTLRALDAALGEKVLVPGTEITEDTLRRILELVLQRGIVTPQSAGARLSPEVLSALITAIAKRASGATGTLTPTGPVPISSSTPPVLTWIDKLFPASEFLAGKKTALSVIAGAALGVLQLTPLGMPATAAQILATLISGVGGLGLLSKVDRGVDLLGMIAKKPPVPEPRASDAGTTDARYGGFAGSVPFWER